MKIYTPTKTCMIFKVDLFIITKNGEQTKCPSVAELINNLRNICTMEYHSGKQRNGLLIYSLCSVKGGRCKMPDTIWFHSWDILEKAKLQRWKTDLCLLGVWMGGCHYKGAAFVEYLGVSWGLKPLCILTVVVVTWLHALVQTHKTVHQKQWILLNKI